MYTQTKSGFNKLVHIIKTIKHNNFEKIQSCNIADSMLSESFTVQLSISVIN